MNTSKVRLAFMGLGNWGDKLADAASRTGVIEVASCFARTPENRIAFGKKFGCPPAENLDEILKDTEVDGVVISTPHSTHKDLILRAASAGKHIFVEKPLALTVEEARVAIDATTKAGVILQVGHHRRRLGATRRIREFIDTGELGMLHQLEGQVYNWNAQRKRSGWQDDPAEWPLGGMTGRGVHIVDNFHYLAGPMKRVFAFSKRLFGKNSLDDITTITLEFEGGALGYIGVSMVLPWTISTAVFGTEAAAWSEGDGARLYLQKKEEPTRTELPVEAGDALAEELAEFAHCIRNGGQPETGGPESLEVVAVLQAIIESVAVGRAIDVSNYRG